MQAAWPLWRVLTVSIEGRLDSNPTPQQAGSVLKLRFPICLETDNPRWPGALVSDSFLCGFSHRLVQNSGPNRQSELWVRRGSRGHAMAGALAWLPYLPQAHTLSPLSLISCLAHALRVGWGHARYSARSGSSQVKINPYIWLPSQTCLDWLGGLS